MSNQTISVSYIRRKRKWVRLNRPTRYQHCWNHDPYSKGIITSGPFFTVSIRYQTVIADGREIAICRPDGEWQMTAGRFAGKTFSSMMVGNEFGAP